MARSQHIGQLPSGQQLSVRVGGQEFAIDAEYVRELRGYAPLTLRPQAPPYLVGLLDLRGTVIPVIDLALRLGLSAPKPTPMSVIVVLESSRGPFGLLVDEVCDLLSVDEGLGDMHVSGPEEGDEQFIAGAIALPSGIINLLRTDNLFAPGAKT